MRHLPFVLSALLAIPADSQVPAAEPRVVRGVVYDSVASAPLAGAVVQAALVDAGPDARSDSTPRVFWTRTDSMGRFQLAGLPLGRFAIGFQHEALNALGLESPLNAFVLGTDSGVALNLAIPGGPSVRAQRCGVPAPARRNDGMLAGYITDARQASTLAGAVVRVSWLEIALDRNDFHTVPNGVSAVVGDDGTYLACGVTSEAPVSITVTRPGFREIDGVIAVPVGGAARQDFRLADSSTVRGNGVLSGRAVHGDGSLVGSGAVTIDALALSAPILGGAFALAGIPAGTWVVEARAIGYEPHSSLIDVADRGSANVRFTLNRRAQMLGAMTVIGKPSGGLKVLNEIVGRSRTTAGKVFLPGHAALKAALFPGDVLRAAPGFTYLSPDSVHARGCGPQSPGKKLIVYLDGMLFTAGFSELRYAIRMAETLAVEAYQDVALAPVQWRNPDACAVVAVWSRR